ncbi:IS3 family transposase [Streptomyces sp. NPDC055006]
MTRESVFVTHAEANLALFTDIDGFYNSQRVRQRLGYLSPIEFEEKYYAGRRRPNQLGSALVCVDSSSSRRSRAMFVRGEVRGVRSLCPACRPGAAARPRRGPACPVCLRKRARTVSPRPGRRPARPVRAADDPSCEPPAVRGRGRQGREHGRAALPTTGPTLLTELSLSPRRRLTSVRQRSDGRRLAVPGARCAGFVCSPQGPAAAAAWPRAVRLGERHVRDAAPKGEMIRLDVHHT